MLCTRCGAQIPDNSRNCPYCGREILGGGQNFNDSNMNNNPNMGNNPSMGNNPYMGNYPNMGNNPYVGGKSLSESQTSYGSNNGQQSWDTWNRTPAAAADQQKKSYIKIGIIGAGVVVAAALILVFGVFGMFSETNRSYEDTIDQAMNASMYGDMSGVFDLIHPDVFSNQIDKILEEYDAEMEYEIRYAEELTGSSLADIQDTYDNYGLDVDEAMLVSVRLTFYSARYDAEASETYDIYLIKIDGNWYLDTENTTDMFGSSFRFSLI